MDLNQWSVFFFGSRVKEIIFLVLIIDIGIEGFEPMPETLKDVSWKEKFARMDPEEINKVILNLYQEANESKEVIEARTKALKRIMNEQGLELEPFFSPDAFSPNTERKVYESALTSILWRMQMSEEGRKFFRNIKRIA